MVDDHHHHQMIFHLMIVLYRLEEDEVVITVTTSIAEIAIGTQEADAIMKEVVDEEICEVNHHGDNMEGMIVVVINVEEVMMIIEDIEVAHHHQKIVPIMEASTEASVVDETK